MTLATNPEYSCCLYRPHKNIVTFILKCRDTCEIGQNGRIIRTIGEQCPPKNLFCPKKSVHFFFYLRSLLHTRLTEKKGLASCHGESGQDKRTFGVAQDNRQSRLTPSQQKKGERTIVNSPSTKKKVFPLCRFNNSARPDTTRAGVYPHDLSAVGNRPYFLNIRQPTPTIFIVGMTDVIPGSRTFSTNFTFSGHDIFSSQGVFFVNFV